MEKGGGGWEGRGNEKEVGMKEGGWNKGRGRREREELSLYYARSPANFLPRLYELERGEGEDIQQLGHLTS